MDQPSRETLVPAKVEDLAWLAEAWTGTVGEDPVDEIWVPPAGGTMIGMFRWLRNDKPRFYEAIALEPHEGGVALRFKHLTPGPGLRSWEKQDEATEFTLTEVREWYAAFHQQDGERNIWLVYRREEDALKVAFICDQGEPPVTKPFVLRRA